MILRRASGVLAHPSSLPGPYGVGDIGPEASRFLEFLAESKQSFWQVLPLNPTGPNRSPYSSFSAFAGNPMLISPDRLAADGLIPSSALKEVPRFPAAPADFSGANQFKSRLLRLAHQRFKTSDDYESFCSQQSAWLDDFALCSRRFHPTPHPQKSLDVPENKHYYGYESIACHTISSVERL